jgi:hypothetical protein
VEDVADSGMVDDATIDSAFVADSVPISTEVESYSASSRTKPQAETLRQAAATCRRRRGLPGRCDRVLCNRHRGCDLRIISGFRLGHAPDSDGNCLFCGEDPNEGQMKGRVLADRIRSARLHIYLCAAEFLKDAQRQGIEAFYPAGISQCPATVLKPGKNDGGLINVNQLPERVSSVMHDTRRSTCLHCQSTGSTVVLGDLDIYRDHILAVHEVWVPGNFQWRKAQELAAQPWSFESGRFPAPVYYETTGRYYVDPVEITRAAMQIYELQFASPAALPYQVKPEHREFLHQTGAFDDDLAADGDIDDKYNRINGLSSVCLREGFCPLCCNDPTSMWMSRMTPFNSHQSLMVEHLKKCPRDTCGSWKLTNAATCTRTSHTSSAMVASSVPMPLDKHTAGSLPEPCTSDLVAVKGHAKSAPRAAPKARTEEQILKVSSVKSRSRL